MTIEVKVVQVPGAVKDVYLEDNANSVSDALAAAGITSTDGFTIKVDGGDATTSSRLRNGSRVILSKGAKGNA